MRAAIILVRGRALDSSKPAALVSVVGKSVAKLVRILLVVGGVTLMAQGTGSAPDNEPARQASPASSVDTKSNPSINELQAEKVRLEVEALKKWWVPLLPYLPGLFAAIAVLAGYIVAQRAGVFEARANFLRAETALLEIRKGQLQAEIDLAPVQALAERIRTVQEVNIGAVEELIKRLEKRWEQRTRDIAYLSTELGESDTAPVARGLLLYCLYHGTSDRVWLQQLLAWAERELPALDSEHQRRGLMILGEKRWEHSDRTNLAEVLLRLSSKGAGLRTQSIRQIARLHENAWNPHERGFRLFESNRDLFFAVVAQSRDIALNAQEEDDARNEAMRALGEIAPPAIVAVAAKLLADPSPESEQNAFIFGGTLLTAVVAANKVNSYLLTAPVMPREEYRYDDGSPPAWSRWVEEHQEFVQLWTDTSLSRLKADPTLFRNMLLFYDDGY